MRAVTIKDGELSVSEHPDPTPGAGEVLVRGAAAGLNGADMMQRRGHYPAPPGAPQDIPGLELAGEVLDRGPGANRFKEGDRVMGIVSGGGQAELAVVDERIVMAVAESLSWVHGGGQAELAVVHERILMAVPERLSWVQAGGTPEVFTTAHDALFTQAGLRLGGRLVFHGGAGGGGG